MIYLIGTVRGKILRLQGFDFIVQNVVLRFALLAALSSCAFFPKEVGEKRHIFSQRPTKVIWLQVPGVSINHFSLVKLSGSIIEQPIPLESALCTGRAWNYSLFEVAPSGKDTIEMQLSGSRNTKKDCQKLPYIWKDLLRYGFTSGVYHVNKSEPLNDSDQMCYEENLNDIALWRSVPTKNLKLNKDTKFHHQERNKQYYLNTAYYDKSCDEKVCHGEFEKNIKTIYEDFFAKREFHFLSIQDFSYQKFIKKQDYTAAKEYLQSLLNVVEYFRLRKADDLLFLVTFVDPVEMLLPPSGKDWKRILDKVQVHPGKLHSEVLAWGAGAEKFCGFYHTSDLKSKLLRAIAAE